MKEPKILEVNKVVNPVDGLEYSVKVNDAVYLSVIRKIKKRWAISASIKDNYRRVELLEKEHSFSMSSISDKLESLSANVKELNPLDEDYESKMETLTKEHSAIEGSIPKDIKDTMGDTATLMEEYEKISDHIVTSCLIACDKDGNPKVPSGYDSNASFVLDLAQSDDVVEEIIAFFLRCAQRSTPSPRLLGLL